MTGHAHTTRVAGPVDFVFIGPDKSGSTWLDTVLRNRDDVDLPIAKELFFFDRYHARGISWYESQFPVRTGQLRGEISHDYLFDPQAIRRLAEMAGDAKLLCCLREPIERAYSAFRYMKYQGRLAPETTFEVALSTVDELLAHGHYGRHLAIVLEYFPRSQLHVGLFDDLRDQPDRYYADVCRFLGIDVVPLRPDQLAPKLAARTARSPALNRVLRRAGWLLRDAGLQSVVGAVKRSRVVGVLSTSGSRERLDLAPFKSGVGDDLLGDIRYAESLSGLPLSTRWGYA